ncbi:hypothetical protein TNCV_4367171 [Trichonephila clavipes]|nr:hypothetical protein TNCV_4367171 [Trichonephila clavipes]
MAGYVPTPPKKVFISYVFDSNRTAGFRGNPLLRFCRAELFFSSTNYDFYRWEKYQEILECAAAILSPFSRRTELRARTSIKANNGSNPVIFWRGRLHSKDRDWPLCFRSGRKPNLEK